MAKLVAAEGPILDRILDDTYEIWNDGLSRPAYGRFYAAQVATPWGATTFVVWRWSTATTSWPAPRSIRFDAMLDGEPVQVAGIGAVFTPPAARGRGAARELIERLLERATADGADLALLFSEIGPDYYARLGFEPIAMPIGSCASPSPTRYGAPMTMVRGGDDRDLEDIVAARTQRGRSRTGFTSIAIAIWCISRSRASVCSPASAPPGARAVHFFIAEEGASAVAYVVISVQGSEWTLRRSRRSRSRRRARRRDPAGADRARAGGEAPGDQRRGCRTASCRRR